MRLAPARLIGILCVALLIGFGAAACGDGEDEPADTPLTPVGLTVEAAGELAESQGLQWRVVEEDGEARPVTMDFVPERLNFVVSEGIVVSAETDAQLIEG